MAFTMERRRIADPHGSNRPLHYRLLGIAWMRLSTLARASRASIDIIHSIANCFRDLMAFRRRDQKLPSHFCEAGTAVFAVEEVE